jgi:hypothetical protein
MPMEWGSDLDIRLTNAANELEKHMREIECKRAVIKMKQHPLPIGDVIERQALEELALNMSQFIFYTQSDDAKKWYHISFLVVLYIIMAHRINICRLDKKSQMKIHQHGKALCDAVERNLGAFLNALFFSLKDLLQDAQLTRKHLGEVLEFLYQLRDRAPLLPELPLEMYVVLI